MFCSSFYYAQILLCKLWKVKMSFSKTPNFKEPDGLKRTKYIIVRYDAQLRKAGCHHGEDQDIGLSGGGEC